MRPKRVPLPDPKKPFGDFHGPSMLPFSPHPVHPSPAIGSLDPHPSLTVFVPVLAHFLGSRPSAYVLYRSFAFSSSVSREAPIAGEEDDAQFCEIRVTKSGWSGGMRSRGQLAGWVMREAETHRWDMYVGREYQAVKGAA